jgi:glutaredoxin-related protein
MPGQLTPTQIREAEQSAATDGFVHRVAVAADQAVNVDTGGLPDETISSRVRRISNAHANWGWNPGVWLAKALNGGLNIIQRNHGQRAEAGDLERALRVAETEQVSLGISGSAEAGTASANSPQRDDETNDR